MSELLAVRHDVPMHFNDHAVIYFLLADSVSSFLKVSGEPLIQRKDDTAAVLKSRLEAFHQQTEPVCFPLSNFYCSALAFKPSYSFCANIFQTDL